MRDTLHNIRIYTVDNNTMWCPRVVQMAVTAVGLNRRFLNIYGDKDSKKSLPS